MLLKTKHLKERFTQKPKTHLNNNTNSYQPRKTIVYYFRLRLDNNLLPIHSFRLFLNSSPFTTLQINEVECDICYILFDWLPSHKNVTNFSSHSLPSDIYHPISHSSLILVPFLCCSAPLSAAAATAVITSTCVGTAVAEHEHLPWKSDFLPGFRGGRIRVIRDLQFFFILIIIHRYRSEGPRIVIRVFLLFLSYCYCRSTRKRVCFISSAYLRHEPYSLRPLNAFALYTVCKLFAICRMHFLRDQ